MKVKVVLHIVVDVFMREELLVRKSIFGKVKVKVIFCVIKYIFSKKKVRVVFSAVEAIFAKVKVKVKADVGFYAEL